MKKEDLIKELTMASELEESYTPVIARFFLSGFDWRGIDEEKVDRVKRTLKTIEVQTLGHNRMLDEMISILKGSDHDEF